jgi:hypothetical protein
MAGSSSSSFWSFLGDCFYGALVCVLRAVNRCLPRADRQAPQPLPPQARVLWCRPQTPAQSAALFAYGTPPFQLGESGTAPDPVSPSEWCRSRGTARGSQVGPSPTPDGWRGAVDGSMTAASTTRDLLGSGDA